MLMKYKMSTYKEKPNKCQSCGGKNISFGKMESFGLVPYGSGYCYYCSDCKNFIVTQRGEHKRALGTIANKDTKALRLECHKYMDALWENSRQRRYYYHKLSKEMDIPFERCHFGMMDKDQLEKALEILKKMERSSW